MRELLEAYLKKTRQLADLDWLEQPEELEALLDDREEIINQLDQLRVEKPELAARQDEELIAEIETLENELKERFEAHLTQLTEQIQNVREEQAAQGKNRRAYQRYFSRPADQPSVYFDEKK